MILGSTFESSFFRFLFLLLGDSFRILQLEIDNRKELVTRPRLA